MGIHQFPAKMLGKIPCYYITDVIQEDAGNGNIRVWNCTRRKGILIPQCEVIIPAAALLLVGKQVADFAEGVFNAEQLRMPGQHVH
jgi:hypothetical protein